MEEQQEKKHKEKNSPVFPSEEFGVSARMIILLLPMGDLDLLRKNEGINFGIFFYWYYFSVVKIKI